MCMKTSIKKEETRVFNEKTGKYEWVWVDVTITAMRRLTEKQ